MGFFSHTWIGCLLAFLPDNNVKDKYSGLNYRMVKSGFWGFDYVRELKESLLKIMPENEKIRGKAFSKHFILSTSGTGGQTNASKFPEEPQKLKIGDDVALAFSELDFRLPTVIYFPPFFDGIDSRNVREVKEGYLEKGGHNFIVVGSERLNAGPWYPTAVSNTYIVGKYTAAFIDYLHLRGLSLKSLHLVGLSIGAHAAGVAGRYMKSGKLSRITGLDPASLLFVKMHRDMRLDETDADLVDVIHTDRVFGMFFPIGDVDFFVNADVYPQPGCKNRKKLAKFKGILYSVFCSHLRSNELYARSIVQPTIFPASKCFSQKKIQTSFCRPDLAEFMGYATSPSARGIYYVRTR